MMMPNQDEIKVQVVEELKYALDYFIERQKLVAHAMVEMGLDLAEVARFKSAAWVSSTETERNMSHIDWSNHDGVDEANRAYLEELFQVIKRAQERNLPSSGVWQDDEGGEWRYFLHGGGCRLRNLKTGEPIDWDCPDVNAYDRYKFLDHLRWQLTSFERAGQLVSSRCLKFDELKNLIDETLY